MKPRSSIISIAIFSLLACGQKRDLPPAETKPVKKDSFTVELMSAIKDLTRNELQPLPAIDQETGEVLSDKKFDGLYSLVTNNREAEYTRRLKSKFKGSGYLIFTFEGEEQKKYIAVIKGSDELDILRYRRTDGINYGLENKDVVKKISEWKDKYGVAVIGCNRDWLQIEFDRLPTDLDEFAKEVYKFCPDSIDQGVGSIEALKDAIKQMNGLWLWWD